MNTKKLLKSILISIFLCVSLISIIRAEKVKPGTNAIVPLAGDPIQYWKNNSGHVIGISDLGSVVHFETPVGFQHIYDEGWGTCYKMGGVDQPPLFSRQFDCSDFEVGGDCDIYQQSLTSNKGAGGTTPATAILVVGNLKVTVVAKDILNNFEFVNSIVWKVSRSRVDIKTKIKNISGSTMTNVLYRRYADIDTDADSSNNWSEQSRSILAFIDKSQTDPPGIEAHTVIMSGFPKPASAEVAEDCCPDDFNACSGYLANNPDTPLMFEDHSGVIEWNLGTLENLSELTRTTTYQVDEDMRK